MDNPFLLEQVQAGVVACTLSRDEPTMAQRICASLASRMAQPDKAYGALQPEWWTLVYDNIPTLGIGSAAQAKLGSTDSDALAAVCLGAGADDEPNGRQALRAWIDALQARLAATGGTLTRLNALTATDPDASSTRISLTLVDLAGGTLLRSEGVLGYGNDAARSHLKHIFTHVALAGDYACDLGAAPNRNTSTGVSR